MQSDNGLNGVITTNVTLSSVRHNGESTIAYPNDSNGWTPFIAYLVKLQPTDNNPWQLFDYQWIYEPAPDLATEWFTQQTTFDFPGFVHIRDFNIAISDAANNVTLAVNYDDTTNSTYTIAPNSGLYTKSYFSGVAKKWKAASFKFTSPTPFRLYVRDSEVHAKPWADSGPYHLLTPFGGPSRSTGATI